MEDLNIQSEEISLLLYKSNMPSTDFKTVYIVQEDFDRSFISFRLDIFDYEVLDSGGYVFKGWKWISQNKKEIFSLESDLLRDMNKVFSSILDMQRYTTWLKLVGHTVEEYSSKSSDKIIKNINPSEHYKNNPLIKKSNGNEE